MTAYAKSLHLGSFAGKNVLVAGGLGFIGSNLVVRLANAGARVSVIDNMAEGGGGNEFSVDCVRSRIAIFNFDLSERKNLSPGPIFNSELDYVFSLAGRTGHLESMNEPLADLWTNAMAELNLLEAIRRHAPRARVVHTGTRQVFGRPRYSPVDEAHPVAPTDINGIHKYCAEEYHRIYHAAYGIRTTVVRLTNTYGPRQLVREPGQGVAGQFIGRALRGDEINIFGDGKQIRDFNYVSDVVDALLLAATADACVGESYNLSGYSHSLQDFLRALGQEATLRTRQIAFPDESKKIDIGSFTGNSEKFQKATGWEPMVDLEQGLHETMKFFRAHARWYL